MRFIPKSYLAGALVTFVATVALGNAFDAPLATVVVVAGGTLIGSTYRDRRREFARDGNPGEAGRARQGRADAFTSIVMTSVFSGLGLVLGSLAGFFDESGDRSLRTVGVIVGSALILTGVAFFVVVIVVLRRLHARPGS